jgi:hypothetical protein
MKSFVYSAKALIFIFPNLRQIYCDANFKGLTKYEPNTFKNLTKLKLLTQVDCGFTNKGIKEVDWSDLVSLQFFHWFGNDLTVLEKSWFESGWSKNILDINMWNNPNLDTVEEGAFENLPLLKNLYLHLNKVKFVNMTLLADHENFVHLTLGP